MRYKWDKKYLYWGVTAFCVIAAYLILNCILDNINSLSSFFAGVWDVLTPVVVGFSFAYILTPIMNFFEKNCFRRMLIFLNNKSDRRKKHPLSESARLRRALHNKKLARALGVTATMLSALILLAALVWAVIPQLVVSFQNILGVDYMAIIRRWVHSLFFDYPEIYYPIMTYVDNSTQTLTKLADAYIVPEISAILSNVTGGIVYTVTAFFNFAIGIIICIYFLYGKDLFAAQGKKMLYALFNIKTSNIIMDNLRHIHKKFGGFIVGKLIDTLIIGLIFFTIFTIIGTPYTILISLVLAVTNIIPVFGPFIGAIPCGLLILFTDPIHLLYFLIVVVVVQQFEGNVLCPKILGDNTGLSSFWVIFAMLIGEYVFGFVGLIIGIPIFAVIYSLFKDFINRKLKYKEIPSDTNYYRELAYFNPESGEAVSIETMRTKEQAERQAFNARRSLEKPPGIIRKNILALRKKKKGKD